MDELESFGIRIFDDFIYAKLLRDISAKCYNVKQLTLDIDCKLYMTNRLMDSICSFKKIQNLRLSLGSYNERIMFLPKILTFVRKFSELFKISIKIRGFCLLPNAVLLLLLRDNKHLHEIEIDIDDTTYQIDEPTFHEEFLRITQNRSKNAKIEMKDKSVSIIEIIKNGIKRMGVLSYWPHGHSNTNSHFFDLFQAPETLQNQLSSPL